MSDYYYTILETQRAEIKEKKSKFIATVIPVSTKDEAKNQLDKIKKEFYDASHNCYAYRIGPKGMEFRAADDGEPSGSAGKPILLSIKKFDVSDVIVVVTRFFGGTKLGKGGLARAYSAAAEEALEMCEKKKIDVTKRVKVFCTYEEINLIKRLLDEYAVSYEESYTDSIDITANIPKSKAEEFAKKIDVMTNAKAGTRILD